MLGIHLVERILDGDIEAIIIALLPFALANGKGVNRYARGKWKVRKEKNNHRLCRHLQYRNSLFWVFSLLGFVSYDLRALVFCIVLGRTVADGGCRQSRA